MVVGTYVGRIFVRMCPSVEDNDRNALLIRLVYGWRDGDLSRCHHQQVHALFHEPVYLLRLQAHIVVGRLYLQVHVIVGSRYAQLLVQLVAPCVFRTLRHAHDKPLMRLSASTRCEAQAHGSCEHQRRDGVCKP